MMFVSFQCWILWKGFWRRWWGWVPSKALSPTAPRQLTGTRWLNLWFEWNQHFNVQEPILKVLQTILPDAPMAALEVCSKTSLWRIFCNFLPQGGHRHWISCGALCSKLPQGSPQETKSIDTIASGDLAALGFELGQYWKRQSQQVRQSSSKADQSAIYESLWIWLIRRRYIKLVKILFQ